MYFTQYEQTKKVDMTEISNLWVIHAWGETEPGGGNEVEGWRDAVMEEHTDVMYSRWDHGPHRGPGLPAPPDTEEGGNVSGTVTSIMFG